MAEAAVDGQRFFCHQCSSEIRPKLPDFTCPQCLSGFIEEMSEESPVPANHDERRAGLNDSVIFSLEAFLNDLVPRQQRQPQRQASSDESSSSRDSRERESAAPGAHTHAHVTMMSDSGQHFRNVLENLLTGVPSGAFRRVVGTGVPGPAFNLFPMFQLHGNPEDYAWGSEGFDNVVSQLLSQFEGSGPPPANKSQIDSLPSVQVSQKEIDQKAQCSVCFEDFELNESVKQLPCQHMYHSSCIVPWLQRHGTCPVCRKNMDGEIPDEQPPAQSFMGSEPEPGSGQSRPADPDQDSYFSFDEEYD